MNLYKTVIKPVSTFATPMRGDTLFGQMCWAIRYAFGNSRLKELLSDYESRPFMIVSDGFATGYLPKPKLPSVYLDEGKDKKANRKKIWLTANDLRDGNFANGKTAKEVGEDYSFTVMHNSINYQTFKTGDGDFAPYGASETLLSPKDIYFLVDNGMFGVNELIKALEIVSKSGYGKNATIGKGRFELSDLSEISTEPSKTVISLSPFVIHGQNYRKCFYEPFTRFGKQGGERANQNPFKKPILMADTGSVVTLDETKPYIGKAVKGHASHTDTVHQGYAIAYPIREVV